jgi:hypothetical protein
MTHTPQCCFPEGAAGTSRAQAIVELALVMPLLLGIVTVLFQFGILFVAYVSIVHEARDIGRFVAVHPDTIDGVRCTDTGSSWAQICADAPSVIDSARITPGFSPACAALVNGQCGRAAGSQLQITLTYDATSIIFLPVNFRLGPWLQTTIPASLPPYTYFVMVEQH